MRIDLQTHGGVAGGIRLPASSLDLTSLSEDLVKKTTRLVEAATRAHPHIQPSGVRPDEISYTITIEDGGNVTRLSEDEMSMTPEFAELLEWLKELLFKRR